MSPPTDLSKHGREFVSASAALELVGSGARVFVHTGAAAPRVLIEALAERARTIDGIEVTHLHTEGPAPYIGGESPSRVAVRALFVGANVRDAVNSGAADYVPVFLSEISRMFHTGALSVDVSLLQVAPPDRHGWCSLGVSVDVSRAAADASKILIGQVNEHMPRTHGDGLIHVSRFAALVQSDDLLPSPKVAPIGPVEKAIGEHAAGLIPDGACLQLGIGSVPDAVADALTGHRRLGVHSEMFSDGVRRLVEAGAVTGEAKLIHRGEIVAGFVMGSQKLYDFVDGNPSVRLLDVGYVNDPLVIRRNPLVVAVNSAIEIDLTGQVCAESIGTRQFSGVGGQLDFMRGAAISEGGIPIIALPSVTGSGDSRIEPMLRPGAGVKTTRSHVHYVITEYGAVNLHGRSLAERAKALIRIAHPNHRERLERAAAERFGSKI
ncbi:MAG: acetyl-CoA hydrolase/transferase C-terminal domain-containing protein [Acidimicrobiia bacterium]